MTQFNPQNILENFPLLNDSNGAEVNLLPCVEWYAGNEEGSPGFFRLTQYVIPGGLSTPEKGLKIAAFKTEVSPEDYLALVIPTYCGQLDLLLLMLADAQYGIKTSEKRGEFKTTTRRLVRDTSSQPENFDYLVDKDHPGFAASEMLRRILHMHWSIDYLLYFQGASEADPEVRKIYKLARRKNYMALRDITKNVVELDFQLPRKKLLQQISALEKQSSTWAIQCLYPCGLMTSSVKDTIRLLRMLASLFQPVPVIETTLSAQGARGDVTLTVTDYPVTENTLAQEAAIEAMRVTGPFHYSNEVNFQSTRNVPHQLIFQAFRGFFLLPGRALPPQMRKWFPCGVPNAYIREHRVNGGSPAISVRSGTLVYVGPGESPEAKRQAVKENKKQIRNALTAVTGKDQDQTDLSFVLLTTKMPINGGNKMQQVVKAARDRRIDYMTVLPVNVVGWLRWPQLTHMISPKLRNRMTWGRGSRSLLAADIVDDAAARGGVVAVLCCASGLDRTGTVELLREVEALVGKDVPRTIAQSAVLKARHDVFLAAWAPAAPGLNPYSRAVGLFSSADAQRLYRKDPKATSRVRWPGGLVLCDIDSHHPTKIHELKLRRLFDALKAQVAQLPEVDARRIAVERQHQALSGLDQFEETEHAIAVLQATLALLLEDSTRSARENAQLTTNVYRILRRYHTDEHRRWKKGVTYTAGGAFSLSVCFICLAHVFFEAFGPAVHMDPIFFLGFVAFVVGVIALAIGVTQLRHKSPLARAVAPVCSSVLEPRIWKITPEQRQAKFRFSLAIPAASVPKEADQSLSDSRGAAAI